MSSPQRFSGTVKFSDHAVYWLFDDDCTDPFCSGYVGITNNLDRRMYPHAKSFANPNYTVLFLGTREQCANEERRYRPTTNIGWNVSSGGFGGRIFPPQSRERVSRALTGKKRSPETCRRISEALKRVGHKLATNKGKKFTEEHKAKLRAQRGWKHSEATKLKMRGPRKKVSSQ